MNLPIRDGRRVRRARWGWCAAVVTTLWLVARLAGQEPRRPPPLPADRLPTLLSVDAVPRGLDPLPGFPDANAGTREQIALGRRLFFDARLSQDQTVSCASCHRPDRSFAGAEPRAVGIRGQVGQRNAPSLLNRLYGRSFFWDGRASSLEEQALQPIENPLEMGNTLPETLARLRKDPSYAAAFARTFPDGVTTKNLARALASFQRVLLSGNSPVDRFLATEVTALSDSQRQGLWLFDSKARCWRCHSGGLYSDESFHNTGVSWGKEPLDLGRYRVTGQEVDRGRFKTPSLRDVARTAPYMHDGSLATLREVVEYYNRGGVPNPQLDDALKPLELMPAEIDHLAAFLGALTGDAVWDGEKPHM